MISRDRLVRPEQTIFTDKDYRNADFAAARKRSAEQRMCGLIDSPRLGCERTVTDDKVEEMLNKTLRADNAVDVILGGGR